jgi:GntR family transcriptional regulator
MFDIQPDSPVPVPEQITGQLIAHIASGALAGGAGLPEYRALAQQLLTNPQVVAKAYADLEWEGVLKKNPGGGMEVTLDAAVICRVRQQHAARQRLCQAVREGLARSLGEADIRQAVDQELALSPPETSKEPAHASGHRASQGIQVLSRQAGRGSAQPDRAPGSHIRPPRR